jgi:hypothetical protein
MLTAEALEREFLSRIALVRARTGDVLVDIHATTAADEATTTADPPKCRPSSTSSANSSAAEESIATQRQERIRWTAIQP